MSGAPFLAHGIGGRSDLPVPVWLAMYAGSLVVVVSFVALVALWQNPKLGGINGGRPVGGTVRRVIDGALFRRCLRALGVALFTITLLTAAFGSEDSARNPAPTWMYVWFWVGLPLVSLVAGPVWRLLNPLRWIADVVPEPRRARSYPERLGYWPAAVSLGTFVWLELAYADAAHPTSVLVFLVCYSVAHVLGARRYGPDWFAHADGFEVYSDLVGRLSPLGRRADGRIVVRNPFDGLAALRPQPGLVAVVCVLLGSTAFDGITRTTLWSDLTSGVTEQPANALLGTAGLVFGIGAVTAIYLAAARGSTMLARTSPRLDPTGAFAHSLIPIALGYTVAHYFSFFAFQGQAGYILASDPFDQGWDLFGTADLSIDYLVVSSTTIALVQVGAIVVGHMAGVVAAHDRALGIYQRGYAVRAQYTLLAAMVVFTLGGIGLLVGSG